jgi:hypothetical protein
MYTEFVVIDVLAYINDTYSSPKTPTHSKHGNLAVTFISDIITIDKNIYDIFAHCDVFAEIYLMLTKMPRFAKDNTGVRDLKSIFQVR